MFDHLNDAARDIAIKIGGLDFVDEAEGHSKKIIELFCKPVNAKPRKLRSLYKRNRAYHVLADVNWLPMPNEILVSIVEQISVSNAGVLQSLSVQSLTSWVSKGLMPPRQKRGKLLLFTRADIDCLSAPIKSGEKNAI